MNNCKNYLYADTVTLFHKIGEVDGKSIYRSAVIEGVKLSCKRDYQKRDLINCSSAELYIPFSRLAFLDDGFSISSGDLFASGAIEDSCPPSGFFRVASVELFESTRERLRHIKVVGY